MGPGVHGSESAPGRSAVSCTDARAESSCSTELTPMIGFHPRASIHASDDLGARYAVRLGDAAQRGESLGRARVVVRLRERPVRAVEAALHQRAVDPQVELGMGVEVVDGLVGDEPEAVVLAGHLRARTRRDVRRRELERCVRLRLESSSDRARLLDPPGRVVGDAETSYGAVADQRAEGRDRLLERRRPVLAVRPVEVDHIDAEALEAARRLALDDRPRQALDATVVGGLDADLGRDDELVAQSRVRLQPAAEQLLALPAVARARRPEGVAVGGVEHPATGLDEPVEQREGRGFVGAGAEVHGAEHEVHSVERRSPA